MFIEKSHTNKDNTFVNFTVLLIDNIGSQSSTITDMLSTMGFDKILPAANRGHALNILFRQ